MVNRQFYHIVSVVLMPLFMPLLGVLFLFQLREFAYLPALFKGVTIGGTVLFTIVCPLVPMLLMRQSGHIDDFFISRREQRLWSYVFSFVSYTLWSCFFWRTLQMPGYVVGMAVGSAASIVLLMVITLKWKISAHMTGIGGFVGCVCGLCYRVAYNPVGFLILILFLSVLLGLARVELKAHTPTQVLAGFVLGFLSVFLCCLFF